MATTVTARANMSMINLILQALGSMEGGMQFCNDNGVSITDVPVPGQVYVVSDAALLMADNDALATIAKDSLLFGNLGGLPPDVLLNDDGVTPMRNDNGMYLYSD